MSDVGPTGAGAADFRWTTWRMATRNAWLGWMMGGRQLFAEEWVKGHPVSTRWYVDPRCDRCYFAIVSVRMFSLTTGIILCPSCWKREVGADTYWVAFGDKPAKRRRAYFKNWRQRALNERREEQKA